jgi:hypothetical protein
MNNYSNYLHIIIYVNAKSKDILTIQNQQGSPYDIHCSQHNKATLHKEFQVLKEITIQEAQEMLRDKSWTLIQIPLTLKINR